MIKILLIDDFATIRLAVKKSLAGGDYEFIEATDGQKGLEIAEKNPDTHLVICDLNMPNLDGFGFVEKFRKLPGREKTPVFLLTTESSPEAKTKAKALGVTGWMIKPFNPESMLAAVKKALS